MQAEPPQKLLMLFLCCPGAEKRVAFAALAVDHGELMPMGLGDPLQIGIAKVWEALAKLIKLGLGCGAARGVFEFQLTDALAFRVLRLAFC